MGKGTKHGIPPQSIVVQAGQEPPAVELSDNRGTTNNLALKRFNFDLWAIPTGLFLLVGVPMLMLFAELFRSEITQQLSEVWEDICTGSMLVGVLLIGYGVVRRNAGRGLILLGLTLVLVVPLLMTTALRTGDGYNGLADGGAGLCFLSFLAGLIIVAKGNGQEEPDVVPRQHQDNVDPQNPWALLLAVFFLALTMLILESGSTSAMLFVGLVGAASLMLFSTMKQRNG